MSRKPVVMVLGVFHFRYLEGVFEPQCQCEIQELVDRIKAFRPTKVGVEVVVEESETLNAEYQKFFSGDVKLTENQEYLRGSAGNEVYQLAFRIARDMGHERIYATDWMKFDDVDKEVLEKGYERVESRQPELIEEEKVWWDRVIQTMTSSGTVLEKIRIHNNDEYNALDHQGYIRYRARLGEFPNYLGPWWLRWWYERNLIVYSNIARMAKDVDDRILIIYGSSHNYLLKQFIRESGLFELESVDRYL